MITGILFAFATGCLWIMVGVFYILISKWKLNVFNITLVTGTISAIIALVASAFEKGVEMEFGIDFPLLLREPAPILYVVFVIIASYIDSIGSLTMQRSMTYGNSGQAWAISQSALIVPFIATTVIFHEPLSTLKLLGTVMIVGGMAFMAGSKSDKGAAQPGANPAKGIRTALLAFSILGIGQSMAASTGHLAYSDPAHVRIILTVIGGFLATISYKIFRRDFTFSINLAALKLIVLMSMTGFLSNYCRFRAIDALSESDMGAIVYPIAIGTCIAGYSIYSSVVIREKLGKVGIVGVAAILSGIVLYIFTR